MNEHQARVSHLLPVQFVEMFRGRTGSFPDVPTEPLIVFAWGRVERTAGCEMLDVYYLH